MKVEREVARWSLVDPTAYPTSPPAAVAETAAETLALHNTMAARIVLAVKASALEKSLDLQPSASLALQFECAYTRSGDVSEAESHWMPALRFRRLL